MLDVAIVGGGPVGATVAALAAGAGLDIAVFEARNAPTNDRRTLALSHATVECLADLGAWPAPSATPIVSIHVSQRGGPGRTLLEAREQGLPALGYTVPYSDLEAALSRRIADCGVAVHFGEACEAITLANDAATLRFASGREASARLLVLADGGANAAKIPGIAMREKDYGQHALVARVAVDRAHGGRAYERFTPGGPIALLPVGEGFALVWTGTAEQVASRLALADAPFLSALQEAFGDRAGRFVSVEARGSFPLKLRTVNTPVALRTAIVGNAAQALHPIAGQGLNLGLRDGATLAALVRSTPRERLGDAAMLETYREMRRRDATRGVAFTDLLVSTFMGANPLVTWGRGAALVALDLVPAARRFLAERMIHGAPT